MILPNHSMDGFFILLFFIFLCLEVLKILGYRI